MYLIVLMGITLNVLTYEINCLFKTAMFANFLVIYVWSCDSDKDLTNDFKDEQQSAKMEQIIAADLVVEDTDMYFDMIIDMDNGASDRSANEKKRELPDCAVVTSVVTNNLKTVYYRFWRRLYF